MDSFHFRFDAMGSGCEVVIVAESKKDAQTIAGCAIEEVSRIERKFSRYRSDSIVSRINAAALSAAYSLPNPPKSSSMPAIGNRTELP